MITMITIIAIFVIVWPIFHGLDSPHFFAVPPELRSDVFEPEHNPAYDFSKPLLRIRLGFTGTKLNRNSLQLRTR